MIGIDNLKGMSVETLQNLIADAQNLLDKYEKERRKAVIKEIQDLAASANLSVEIKEGDKVITSSKGVPRYRNPNDPQQTWSGRGKRPNWLNKALESGKKLDDFTV
jgi:DNA-binding protein H-NS